MNGENENKLTETGYIQPTEITQEMEEAYLDYAMSVIVGRALPDVRDGLKPVHRRILYAMWDVGLRSNGKFKKSATVVGEVLGKYHPHGDVAVYDSMVRMAQDFSMRYPLVHGQGNFGSMDGDAPAAMRYTEAKMSGIAEEMLLDIEKNTVDFIDNYDGSRQEPLVLPAKIPQMLLNGSVGIAVGMATYIPPHNLSEIVDATVTLIDNPKATGEDLLQFVKGPDFPTGAFIYDKKAIAAAYATGKGAIVCRAKAEITEDKKGRFKIIVSEMPYQVNKASLLEKIAELVKTKKIEGIKDLRDESDKDGVRVVVELKADAFPQKVLNRLFKLTDLQKTFHLNMLSLVDGLQPQVLSLKSILEYYIKHRREVITRRTQFELDKAKDRAHILEGLKKALDHIDEVIATIKKSPTKEEAHANLMGKFKLSDRQASAILEMRLQTLAGLERKKIEDELKEKIKLIAELEALLGSPKKILGVVKKELLEIKGKYGDERRTRVFASAVGQFSEEDLIPNEECIIALTKGGYIKRMNPKNYKLQKRGGKGIIGIATREEDAVDFFFSVSTHDNLLFFTNNGKVFQTKAYEIPETSRVARGQAVVNFLQLAPGELVTAMVPVLRQNQKADKEDEGFKEDKFLVMTTNNGIIKKTPLSDFANARRNGLIAISLQKGSILSWAQISEGRDQIILATASGQGIHFNEKDVRPMGRTAAGVKAIKLKKGDQVVGMSVIKEAALQNKNKQELIVVTENGYGKRTDLKLFKIQKRGGSGLKAANVTSKTGKIISAFILNPQEEDLIAISAKGQVIRTQIASVSVLGRATQGVRVMKVNPGDKVVSVTTL